MSRWIRYKAITEQNRRAYDSLAARYSDCWTNSPDEQLIDFFDEMLPEGAKLLDVGCGPGHYSSLLGKRGYHMRALDISKSMVKEASLRNPDISVSQMDMANLQYDNSEFDGLWVCASLPHIPKEFVEDVLREFSRVLKPEGVLFVNIPIGDLDRRIEAADEFGYDSENPGRFFQWYSSRQVFREIIGKSGFKIILDSEREITSRVLEHSSVRKNTWYNCYCKLSP